MEDEHFKNNKLVELYDLQNIWGNDNNFYLNFAKGINKLNILDIGCGTGLISLEYSKFGHNVTGIDPSKSMIYFAKSKDKYNKVTWIEKKGENYLSNEKFDLIIMTGHTFQVFLSEKDILKVFKNIKSMLHKNSIFVFESRNPYIDWVSKFNNTKILSLASGEKVSIQTTNIYKEFDNISFSHIYTFGDKTEIISNSTIKFLNKSTIDSLLTISGLEIVGFYGDWDKSIFNKDSSLEMIYVVKSKNDE